MIGEPELLGRDVAVCLTAGFEPPETTDSEGEEDRGVEGFEDFVVLLCDMVP